LISSTKMRSSKSLHNLQHDEGGNYMAETETETENTLLNPQALMSDGCIFQSLTVLGGKGHLSGVNMTGF
jgi:hypothetical protein